MYLVVKEGSAVLDDSSKFVKLNGGRKMNMEMDKEIKCNPLYKHELIRLRGILGWK